MRPARALIIVAALLLGATTAHAATTHPPASQETIDEALRASGVPENEIAERRAAVQAAIAELADLVGPGDPTYRRARRLHRTLHERYLREYVPESDSLDDLVRSGRYNCLSATLFEALTARTLGYEAHVLEAPGHIWLELHFDDGVVQIETTSRGGFDIERQLQSSMSHPVVAPQSYRWLHWPPTQSSDTAFAEPGRFTAGQAAGFVWLNSGWRALANGDAERAAECVRNARRLLPPDGLRSEAADRLLARAFAAAYETGDFEAADTIARLSLLLDPGSTSSRDRTLVAGLKRIEGAIEEGRHDVAEHIVEEMASLELPASGLARVERRAWPLIAASAVRAEDWALATRSVARYAAVEPDEVEVRRLGEWIALRRAHRPVTSCDVPILAAAFLFAGP